METIIGAAIAIVGSIAGSFLLDWLSGRRFQRELKQERIRKLGGLAAELEENSALKPSGPWRKFPFVTDVWEDAKPYLTGLGEEIEWKIRHAYVLVRSHNALVDYDRSVIPYGRGDLDSIIEDSTSRVIEAMQEALASLNPALTTDGGTSAS